MATNINRTALPLARELIGRDLPDLDDLPPELQNTIANIYYNFATTFLAAAQKDWVPTKGGQLADLKDFVSESSFYQAAFEALPQSIYALRKMRNQDPPWLYDYTVTYILDLFKYRLPQWAMKLPPILRAPLRFLSDAPVKEIPNLYKFLRRDRA